MAQAAPLLLAVALCATWALASGSPSGRLVEKDISLPVQRPPGLRDVPVVDPPKRVAGYFKLNRTHDAHLFYFFFQSRSKPATDPVVLWMTGGPGCSSELAILYENGPYALNHNLTLFETVYGWDTHHNMIFVDQPVNTGFSYSKDPRDRVHDEKLVGEDMLDFLQEFFKAHPDLAENEFYVTGESYAGHYVPAVSYRVYRSNELGQFPYINLKGLAIGNGLTDPAIQFPAYADYALQNKLIGQGLYDSIKWWMPLCKWGADLCDAHDISFVCVLALEVCQLTSFERILMANPGINVYDITKTCDAPLCYDFSDADKFLNRKDVRDALGVGSREWVSCDMGVHADMTGDWLKNYDWMLKPLLEDGIRVMIYAGDLDLICNWVGNEKWVDALQWEGGEDWMSVQAQDWSVAGAAAGSARELGPLSFVRVYQAGHMVPMDQPRNALAMITRFTRGRSMFAADADGDDAEAEEVKAKAWAELAAASRASRSSGSGSGGSAHGEAMAARMKQALGRHQIKAAGRQQ